VIQQYFKKGSKKMYFLHLHHSGRLLERIEKSFIDAHIKAGKNYGVFSIEDSYRQTYADFMEIFKSTKSGYFLAYRDSLAAAVINAAIDSGLRVPQDVEVLSIIGTKYVSIIRPQLSSLHLDLNSNLLNTPTTIYCGFDPSAISMHLGNFVQISILMRLQRAGHRIIAVVGGATGMIGDPSGKSKERNLLNAASIEANTQAIKKQLERYLDFSDPKKGIVVNNFDWLGKLSMIDYLRDYGKYFPINYMLAKDVVANRLETGLSYTEFSYMMLQSIDFLHLYQQFQCRLQFGGSDQWGNLTSGLELIRKIGGMDAKAGVFTTPLITRSDGKKW